MDSACRHGRALAQAWHLRHERLSAGFTVLTGQPPVQSPSGLAFQLGHLGADHETFPLGTWGSVIAEPHHVNLHLDYVVTLKVV